MNGKIKQRGRAICFEKNLRLRFDRVFDFESNGNFSSLAPSRGKLSLFEILKMAEHLQPTQNFLLYPLIKKT